MKILLSILFLLVLSTAAKAEESCSPGQTTTLVQTGLSFDMVWVGFENGKDKGTFKPYQSPVSAATVCHWSLQEIHIQEAVTHHWYKLVYRKGILTELEALK